MKLTPIQKTSEASPIFAEHGRLLAQLYRMLSKRRDLASVTCRFSAEAADGDAKITIVEKHPEGNETVLAEHTLRGIDDEGVVHFLHNGEVLPVFEYFTTLGREAGLSEKEMFEL
jgi:hypothetical protein